MDTARSTADAQRVTTLGELRVASGNEERLQGCLGRVVGDLDAGTGITEQRHGVRGLPGAERITGNHSRDGLPGADGTGRGVDKAGLGLLASPQRIGLVRRHVESAAVLHVGIGALGERRKLEAGPMSVPTSGERTRHVLAAEETAAAAHELPLHGPEGPEHAVELRALEIEKATDLVEVELENGQPWGTVPEGASFRSERRV